MIRLAAHKDYDVVMKIWLDTNIETHFYIPKSFWQTQADKVRGMLKDADIYVFEESGQIKGFIGIMYYDYIAGLFVAKPFKHRGIGTKLLKKVQDIYEKLELNVYQKNKNAICFYEKNGFQIQKQGTNADTNEPEFLMRWNKTHPKDT